MAEKKDYLKTIAFGALLMVLPLTGILSTFFPAPACNQCGLLDVMCYASLPQCVATQAAAGAVQSIINAMLTFGGFVIIIYGGLKQWVI